MSSSLEHQNKFCKCCNNLLSRMLNADPSVVSSRAKKRGLPQLGTLGAGNHYAEIQVRRSEKTPFIHMERTYHILTAILGCRRDL